MTTNAMIANNVGELEEARKCPRMLIVLFSFCMFSTGASGLVNEYILATVSSFILGNSIEQFSVIIACMMLAMGLSGFGQALISDENLLGKFIIVETLMVVLCSFSALGIYAGFGFLPDHFMLILYFFVLSIGFLIGFEIPLVIRIIVNPIDAISIIIDAMIFSHRRLTDFPYIASTNA